MVSVLKNLVFLLLLALPANVVLAQDPWITVKSENFKFYGNGNRESLSETAEQLEQFRSAFSSLFPTIQSSDPVETKVFYFRSQQSFKPFLPKRQDGTPDTDIVGYFLATESANYIAVSGSKGKRSKGETIYHEYIHYWINNNFRRDEVPAWLNEGLAEYYSTLKVRDNRRIYLGDLIDSHIYVLRDQKPIPVTRLFEFENADIHRNGLSNRTVFYAQSWALVHMLASEKRLENVEKFIELIRKTKDHKKAFEQAFGLTYAEVDSRLDNYAKKNKFRGHVRTLGSELAFDKSQKFDVLSRGQSLAELGALAFHKGEHLVAEGLSRDSLELEPNNSVANTTIGLIRLQQEKHSEARKYLEKAINKGTDNYYAQYSYAYVLSRIGMDKSGFVTGYTTEDANRMRKAVLRAIELHPDFVPSYNLLAFVNLVTGKNLKESIKFIEKVLKIQPGNESARLTLAQIYLREGRFNEAEEIAKRILKSQPLRQNQSTARSVLRDVERAREVERQNRALDKRRNAGEKVPAVVVVRDELSEEDIARIQLEREISVLNQSLIGLGDSEKRLLGYISAIECSKEGVKYRVKTKDGRNVTLSSKDFNDLQLTALRTQPEGASFGCDARLSSFLSVLNYVEVSGERLLKAVTFVPAHFRFKSKEEILKDTSVMVVKNAEGNVTNRIEVRDAPVNESSAESENREKIYRNAMIKASLRKPASSEERAFGVLDRISCTSDGLTFHLSTRSGVKEFFVSDYRNLNVSVYLKDSTSVRIGCGIVPPKEPIIVTYKKKPTEQNKLLVSFIEVVPEGFKFD